MLDRYCISPYCILDYVINTCWIASTVSPYLHIYTAVPPSAPPAPLLDPVSSAAKMTPGHVWAPADQSEAGWAGAQPMGALLCWDM